MSGFSNDGAVDPPRSQDRVTSALGVAGAGPSKPAAPDRAIERAIVETVAYADVFDYPLTAAEVHRYLVRQPALPEAVAAVLADRAFADDRIAVRDGYVTLPGRETIIETRRRRARIAAEFWPQALSYGRLIGGLPFVRMVALTGALAIDNVDADADIDYLVVAEADRLWLCRALIIAVVRLAARRGHLICPNYIVSERALVLEERSLFTAHEFVQMVPLAGLDTHERMRRLNDWTAAFLPNANGPARHLDLNGSPRAGRLLRSLAELAGRTPPGDWLDQWEMRRKVRKFARRPNGHGEAGFSRDLCKGHFEGHGRRIVAAFESRLRDLEARLPR